MLFLARPLTYLGLSLIAGISLAQEPPLLPTLNGDFALLTDLDWQRIGDGYAGAEGTQWIEEDGVPTFIYAAHHDHLVFQWSPATGRVTWRDDSPYMG